MENLEIKKIQEELKKEIPFKWRVQSFSKNKPVATCVAYIDSRDVQDVLDKNCVWSDRYYESLGLLFCEITIYADGREYKRSDTGTESMSDKEKGHSSDAFKRAAVKFGVGRFLYSLPIQYLKANEVKTNSNYPYVVDNSGKRVYDITEHVNNLLKSEQPVKKQTSLVKPTPNQLEAMSKSNNKVALLKALTTFDLSEKQVEMINNRIKVLRVDI